MGTELTPLPKIRQCFYTTYALLPTTGLNEGDIGYATDTLRLYRWSGAAWQTITAPSYVSSGTYLGNSSVNRAIPHGLGVIPKLILCVLDSSLYIFLFITSINLTWQTTATMGYIGVTSPDITNFYVGNATNYNQSANLNAVNYYWVAIG